MNGYQKIFRGIVIGLFTLFLVATVIAESRRENELINLLSSKDHRIREKSSQELIKLGDKVIPILEEHLKSSDDPFLRFEIVQVLSQIHTKKATEILMKIAIDKNKTETERINAIRGLKGRKVKSDVLISLLNDEDEGVRYGIWHADLIHEDVTDQKVINTLKDRLFKEKHWQIKGWIATKISKLSNLDTKTKVELLLKVLKEQYKNPIIINEKGGEGGPKGPITGSVYIYDLVAIGTSAIPFLKRELEKEKDKIKEIIIIVLGLLKDKEVFPYLLDISLNSKDGWNRVLAVRALGEIGNKKAIPVLKKALRDSFWTESVPKDIKLPSGYEYMEIYYPVRQEAFFALTKLGVKVKRKGNTPDEYHEYIIVEE